MKLAPSDLGNWINLPYFGGDTSNRRAVGIGGQLTLHQFLDIAENVAVTKTELAALTHCSEERDTDLLDEAPPCLQCLAKSGCNENRNLALFNFAVYAQKRFGDDDVPEKVDEYNQLFISSPLGHKEVAHLVKSVLKKQYSYKCKEPPINTVCDRDVCLTRTYGIRGAERTSRKRPPLDVLLQILEEAEAEFWHTSDRRTFISLTVGEHREHLPVDSTDLKRVLVHSYYRAEGKALAGEALNSSLRYLDARAAQEGATYDVAVRIARIDCGIYIDLGNSDREIVHIHAGGWEIVGDAPVRFYRPQTMRALPRPVRGGNLSALRPFITIRDDDDWRLLVGFLLSCLRAAGPYPQLHLSGVQGSAKTTLARMILAIIDPSTAGVRAAPTDERDLVIAAKQAHLLAFDNVSNISPEMSDALCRLSTGGGLGTRKLYTDTEQQVFEVMRPAVLNGIELGGRPDLRDRAFILDLPSLNDRDRKDEATLWAEFELALPAILGALYGVVSCALREWERTTLTGSPRMADSTRWISAAESALGWPPGSFVSLYRSRHDQNARRAVEQDILAWTVIELVEEYDYQLTPMQLLKALNDIVQRVGLDVTRKPFWPQGPRMLTSQLKRIQPDLEKVGIHVKRGRGDERWILIFREGRTAPPKTSYDDWI